MATLQGDETIDPRGAFVFIPLAVITMMIANKGELSTQADVKYYKQTKSSKVSNVKIRKSKFYSC